MRTSKEKREKKKTTKQQQSIKVNSRNSEDREESGNPLKMRRLNLKK